MGKASYSPLGQWRNKVGGQVYRIDSGEQIVSAYQPIVKNPRTVNQIVTRAKFTTATRYVAGFKPFIDVMNPTGSRRILRSTIMKKVMATMTGESISQVAQNGNLVLNKSELFTVSVNPATLSGNTFTVVGAIAFGTGVSPTSFVNREMTVYFGVQFLNADGTVMRRTLESSTVDLATSPEFTFNITLDSANYTGALYEAGGMGVLTAEAWSRFSVANAIDDADTTAVLDVYSEANARVYSNNAGGGVIRP